MTGNLSEYGIAMPLIPDAVYTVCAGYCRGITIGAIQTEVGPLTVPTIILFFATFIEAASLSPNRTSIIAVKSPLFKFTVLLPQRQFYCCRNCFRTIFMIRSISSFVFLISLGRQSPLLKISSLTSVWMAGKKAPPQKPFSGWIEGTSEEVICLGFIMDIGRNLNRRYLIVIPLQYPAQTV